MSLSGITLGGEGYVGIADESTPGGAGTPGTFVTPGQFLLTESSTLDSVPAMVKRDVLTASRDVDRAYRTAKYSTKGALMQGLFTNNGILTLSKAIGKVTPLSAVTADTCASIVTALGISTITLTTGTGAYVVGAFVTIDATTKQELRQILSWDSVGKVITVGALDLTHGATPAFHQIAQDEYSPFITSDGHENLLGTLSVEEDHGGRYSWQYAWGQISKWTLDAKPAKMDVTSELVFNAQRVKPGSPTAFNESDATLNDLSFEFTDGFLCFPADPTSSNASTLQRVGVEEDWKIDINNNHIERALYDGGQSTKHYPGPREITVDLKVLQDSNRPVYYQDFLAANLDMPFFGHGLQNVGTLSAPAWNAIGFYAPFMRLQKVTELRAVKDLVGEQITAALRRNAADKLRAFVVHS